MGTIEATQLKAILRIEEPLFSWVFRPRASATELPHPSSACSGAHVLRISPFQEPEVAHVVETHGQGCLIIKWFSKKRSSQGKMAGDMAGPQELQVHKANLTPVATSLAHQRFPAFLKCVASTGA